MNRATMDKLVSDLSAVQGIKTVKVGIEPNRTPDSYPMIRIVPQLMERSDDYYDSVTETVIYFAEPIHQAIDDLIDIYESQMDLNSIIVEILETSTDTYSANWVRTEFDDDQFQEFKVAAATFNIYTHC